MRQNVLKLRNFLFQLRVFAFNLIALQSRKLSQAHIHNRLSLNVVQLKALHERCLCVRNRLALFDYLDNLVDIVNRLYKTFQYMGAGTRLCNIKLRAADDYVFLVLYVFRQDFLDV